MAILPKSNNAPGQNIADILDREPVIQNKRGYLGYSNSGEPCLRKIWYSFRWADMDIISEQTNRIFNIGHTLEAEIKKDLVNHGFTIINEQLSVEGCYGHAQGHIDGLVSLPDSNEVMLLEIKTSNTLAWSAIVKRGVQKEKPGHYLQMQAYMGKLDLKQALYVCYNKNTSEYYTEIVEFNQIIYSDIDRKFNSVLMSEFPPDKIGDSSYFACQWCAYKAVCHEQTKPKISCRTCEFANIEMEGKWSCSKHDMILEECTQKIGCEQYKMSMVL